MKKYYAKEVRDYFDYEAYFNEEEAIDRHIWLGGNSDFISINKALLEDVKKILTDIAEDLDYFASELVAGDITPREIVEDYFSKESHEALSDEEIATIVFCANQFQNGSFGAELDSFCKILSIKYKLVFDSTVLRGNSQGDYIYCIYPQETASKETLDYIEAVFFGTGTEFAVTVDPIESAKDFDDAEVYYTYTDKYRDEDVKAFIANDLGCSPEDVVLLLISGEHHITTYDYEER